MSNDREVKEDLKHKSVIRLVIRRPSPDHSHEKSCKPHLLLGHCAQHQSLVSEGSRACDALESPQGSVRQQASMTGQRRPGQGIHLAKGNESFWLLASTFTSIPK